MTPAALIPAQPHRIQRQRTKGWRMPEGAVYVGRPTRWGNPVPIEPTGQFDAAGRAQYVATLTRTELAAIRRELRGKVLCCWCRANQACHADVLLEIANG